MKISLDDKDLFILTETQKKVIKNDIYDSIFEDDMKRRIQWVVMNKYERSMDRLKNEWLPKLKHRVSSVPTDDEALAALIFSQPDYKSRSQRESIE